MFVGPKVTSPISYVQPRKAGQRERLSTVDLLIEMVLNHLIKLPFCQRSKFIFNRRKELSRVTRFELAEGVGAGSSNLGLSEWLTERQVD